MKTLFVSLAWLAGLTLLLSLAEPPAQFRAMADSSSEKSLRLAVEQLTRENKELMQWLTIARGQAYGSSSIPSQIKRTADTTEGLARSHKREIAAVLQTQAESTAAAGHIAALAAAQMEYEKQLAGLQKDLRTVVGSEKELSTMVRRVLYALAFLMILLLLFTGVIAYTPRRLQAKLDALMSREKGLLHGQG